MNECKIYTAGKMGGLSFQDQMKWRREFEIELKNRLSYKGIRAIFIHPPEYYQPDDSKGLLYEKEAMEWDVRQLKDSDIVVVSLDGIETSIGTVMEVAFAKENGKTIVVIGSPSGTHPWIRVSATHFSPHVAEAADYISDFCMI